MSHLPKLAFLLIFLLTFSGEVQAQFYKEFYKQSAYEASLIKKAGYRRMQVESQCLSYSAFAKLKVTGYEYYNEDGRVTESRMSGEPVGYGKGWGRKIEYYTNGIVKRISDSVKAFKGGYSPCKEIIFDSTGGLVTSEHDLPMGNPIKRSDGATIAHYFFNKETRILKGYKIRINSGDTLNTNITWLDERDSVSAKVTINRKNDTTAWIKINYDSTGRRSALLESITSHYRKQKSEIYDSTSLRYEYDTLGRVVRETKLHYQVNFKSREAKLFRTLTSEFQYNAKGEVVEIKQGNRLGTERTWITFINKTYYKNGLIKEYMHKDEKGKMYYYRKYTYYKK